MHLRHMEVPGRGVELELWLPAYTTALATLDPRRICDLHCSLWHSQILNPLKEARDRTCILTDMMLDSFFFFFLFVILPFLGPHPRGTWKFPS